MRAKEITLLAFACLLAIFGGITLAEVVHGNPFPGHMLIGISEYFWDNKANDSNSIPAIFGSGMFTQAEGKEKIWVAWDANGQKYCTFDGGKTWAKVVPDK